MASVADGAMAPTRVEILTSDGMVLAVPSSCCVWPDSLFRRPRSNSGTDERERPPDYDPPRPSPVRWPVRLRPVQGPDGGAGRAGGHRPVLHGHQPPPARGEIGRRPDPVRPGRPLLPPRGL